MNKDKITSLQYATLTFFLLNSFLMNIGYYSITKINENDSIFDILIGGIGIIILFLIVSYIRSRNKDNIIQSVNRLFPKVFRIIFFFITFIILGFTSIYSFTILISFIQYYILKEVSLLIISVTLISTIIYIVRKGLKTISKLSEIFFYVYLLIILISIIGLVKYMDLSNLKPLFIHNISNHFDSSILYFISSIIPLFLLLIIPNIPNKSNLKFHKVPLFMTIFTILLCFIQLIIIISVLGINLTNIYQNPDMIVYKKISFLNILERVEVFLAFNNILNSLFIIIMCIYFMKEVMNNFISIKKEPISLALIAIFIIIISNTFYVDLSIYLFVSFITLVLLFILFFNYFLNNNNH